MADVYRGVPLPDVVALAERLVHQGELFGVQVPSELRASLLELESRRSSLRGVFVSPTDLSYLTRTLDAYGATALLAYGVNHPNHPISGVIAATFSSDAAPKTFELHAPNSAELGNFQEAVAVFLGEHSSACLDALVSVMPEFRQPMPVLDAMVDELVRNGDQPLDDANVCVIGHILSEAPAMMAALARLGAAPATTFVAPVAYSSNALAVRAVELMGHRVVVMRQPAVTLHHVSELSSFASESHRALFRRSVGEKSVHEDASLVPARDIPRLSTFGVDFIAQPPRTRGDVDLQMTQGGAAFDALKNQQIERVLSDVLSAARANGKRIVVIDDGGYALDVVQKSFPGEAHRFCFVEQTTRGIRKAQKRADGAHPPVVDVARSEPKRRIEAPFVAEACCAAVRSHVALLFDHVEPGSKAAILGYGTIGEPVARALEKLGFAVTIYDASSEAASKARSDGFATVGSIAEAVSGQRLVLGCTGTEVLQPMDYERVDAGTVFGSLSSADVEFQSTQWARWGSLAMRLRSSAGDKDAFAIRGAPTKLMPHLKRLLTRRYAYLRRELADVSPAALRASLSVTSDVLFFLNGGFPLNLTRQLTCMPAKQIQVTIACLVAGAAQDTRGRAGIVPLEAEDRITALYNELAG